MQAEAALIFSMKDNNEHNNELMSTMYDLRDQGKRDAEHQYKKQLMHRGREYK